MLVKGEENLPDGLSLSGVVGILPGGKPQASEVHGFALLARESCVVCLPVRPLFRRAGRIHFPVDRLVDVLWRIFIQLYDFSVCCRVEAPQGSMRTLVLYRNSVDHLVCRVVSR